MHLCRFDDDRLGFVRDGRVFDITHMVEPSEREPVLAAAGMAAAFSDRDLSRLKSLAAGDVCLHSPIRMPSKIFAAPDNYRAHAAEMQADPVASFGRKPVPLDQAGLFLKAAGSLVGPSHGVVRRFPSRRTDYEVELVVIIGSEASDVPSSRALDIVAGYSIGLDITVRGTEDRSFRKSLDSYTVVGPWMTPASSIADLGSLSMTLKLNGEIKQHTRLDDMITSVSGLIAYASAFARLRPGDMIFTGTPAGVGPIRGGDTLLAQIDMIGEMQVSVRDHVVETR
ncbi:fumarylacetoacetate hydrolase family protein [Bradyrhizobium manausense]|uniref:fumarylacetoacetate hydrolase family protein n=1 Tax=Bradyrhizobium TaxID=374 RepID=UPI001BAE0632|nr:MULTISPECIES: fumarylacetoacetate hydrolase family protein [Bradyrhizobium]MBR0831137.1 fumarylacetoacetate hydrolase family protein [Bradyrhizobium manausense]UVO29170.1 fumarylacetoacetate hydrolase family protein [Bradyrhizobium arachidis]